LEQRRRCLDWDPSVDAYDLVCKSIQRHPSLETKYRELGYPTKKLEESPRSTLFESCSHVAMPFLDDGVCRHTFMLLERSSKQTQQLDADDICGVDVGNLGHLQEISNEVMETLFGK
jgi:hypothetical protein